MVGSHSGSALILGQLEIQTQKAQQSASAGAGAGALTTAGKMQVFSSRKDISTSLRSLSFFTLCPMEQGLGR